MPYVTAAFTIMIDFQKMSISIIRIFLLLKLFALQLIRIRLCCNDQIFPNGRTDLIAQQTGVF